MGEVIPFPQREQELEDLDVRVDASGNIVWVNRDRTEVPTGETT